MGADKVDALNRMACGEVMPDLTIFLDLSPSLAFARKGGADIAYIQNNIPYLFGYIVAARFSQKNCVDAIFFKILSDKSQLSGLTDSPSLAFARKGGADSDDRLEQEGFDFHNKVYDGYQQAANPSF